MKEIISYVAKDQCFEEASDTVEKLLGVRVDDNSVHRIADECGHLAEELLEQRCVEDTIEGTGILYAGMDGTMILKREEGWKEVKVARVFEAESIRYDEANLQKRSNIVHSEYMTHFGESEEFGDKLKSLLGTQSSRGPDLVFLVDGARWMKLWIDCNYPNATQILDYYHAVENLSKYAEMNIDDDKQRKKWIQDMKTVLLEQGGEKLLVKLKQKTRKKDKKTKAYDKLMVYLNNNIERMNYPEYEKRGLYIGSGSIESAHRTVVHKRLKLSGQRWTKRGADKIMSLRVLHLSNRWEELSVRMRKRA